MSLSIIAKSKATFNRIFREQEALPSETFLQQRESEVDEAISVIPPGGHCKPLGDPSSGAQNSTSSVLLPPNSLVIIRRPCVSLKCICSSEGNWVCADFCIPCEGVALQNNHDTSAQDLQLDSLSSVDGCCPKCSGLKEKTPSNSADRYSIAIACFLALLALTPIFVTAVCCIFIRYRQKLKNKRTTEFNSPTKFHLRSEPGLEPTQSARSSFALPLSLSINEESSSSPPIRLKIVPATFGGHQSVHHSLLFDDKLDAAALSSSNCWRLSASYTCLSTPKQDSRNLSNPDFAESTPRKSLMTTSTGCSDNASSKNSAKVIQTRFAVEDTPLNDVSTSNSSSHFRKSDFSETTKVLDWRSRLRRNSTQTRTHFFPQAWKAVLSKSAVVTTPSTNRDETPFFKQHKPSQSEASQQLIRACNSASVDSAEDV